MVCQNKETKYGVQDVAVENDVDKTLSFNVSPRPVISKPSSLTKCVLHS